MAFYTRGDRLWGMGHLHRVSWLAAALGAQQPAPDVLVSCSDSPEAREFWRERPVNVHFHSDMHGKAVLPPPGTVAVVDWLDSSPEQITALGVQGARVCLLDDYGPAQAQADLVINALLSPLRYEEKRVGRARVLAGAPFVQLPPSAVKLRRGGAAAAHALQAELRQPTVPLGGQASAVLVSFGGNVNDDAVGLALSALAQAGYGGRVVVMPWAGRPGKARGLDVEWRAGGDEFHAVLAACDLAVLAGGLSLYEAAYLGVPAVCIAVAGHQAHTGRKLAAAECCRYGGLLPGIPAEGETLASADGLAALLKPLLEDHTWRGRISAAGQATFDGGGLMRTMEQILGLLQEQPAQRKRR
jgi:spore coat polysaccharide biosynthesis predicted glycosyltransferase SpsG